MTDCIFCKIAAGFIPSTKVYEDKKILAISTTEIIYPYLRTAVSNLMSNAFVAPITLPVIPAGTMFPEDRMEDNSFDAPSALKN